MCDIEDHCEHTPGEPGRRLGWLISRPETLSRTLVERVLDWKNQPLSRWLNNYPELLRAVYYGVLCTEY